MYIDNDEIAMQKAIKTKEKWEQLVNSWELYKCQKCGEDKPVKDFVIHRMKNHRVWKFRYLYECKLCKRNRIYSKREVDRKSIDWALKIIYKQLESWAKSRKIDFSIDLDDLLYMRENQGWLCYYTWDELQYEFVNGKTWSFSERTKMQISCDRLDPSKWYEKGNIVFCSTIINRMKNILSEPEFYETCKKIISHKNL